MSIHPAFEVEARGLIQNFVRMRNSAYALYSSSAEFHLTVDALEKPLAAMGQVLATQEMPARKRTELLEGVLDHLIGEESCREFEQREAMAKALLYEAMLRPPSVWPLADVAE